MQLTLIDLSQRLSIALGQRKSPKTLYSWLNEVGIGAKPFYTEADLATLEIYGLALKVQRSKEFAINRVKEYHLGNHQNRTAQTIEVEARPV